MSRGPGLRVELEPDGARLTASRARGQQRGVHLRWVGGLEPASIAVHDPLPGKVHYYSADPARSYRDVPTFGRVVYRSVYPGTDLVFHGSQGAAEFDFVVAPDADPGVIRLEIDGADRLTLDRGNIGIDVGDETLTLHAPVLYQEYAGGRTSVAGRFRLEGRRIAFDVGQYDRTRPLVIDPVVTYSTYLNQGGRGIGVDAAGNMYVAGGGGVLKLNATGSTLLYSVDLSDMAPYALAVDSAGHAYLAASCPYPRSGWVPDCPASGTPLAAGRPTAQGDIGVSFVKLSPTGALLYATSLGGFGTVEPGGIALDPAGNIYLTGWNAYGGFPGTRPPFARPGVTTGFPTFVQAIAADLSRYIYAVEFRLGDSLFRPRGIAVDRTGAAYVTGTAGPGFPTTPGVFQAEPGPDSVAAVIAKIAPDASRLMYATYLGNGNTDPRAIAVDTGGNAYIAGTAGPGLPTHNALQPALAGGTDAFVTRLNPTGSAPVFSTYVGGGRDDRATTIALDSSTNIYVGGQTSSTDFPQRSPLAPTFGTAASNFVTALTSNGASFIYSTYFANAQTLLSRLVTTANGIVYVTGSTSSTSYPTVRPFQAVPGPAFLARIDPAQPRAFITSPAPNATVAGTVTSDVWMENTAVGSRTIRLSIGSVTLATTTSTANHVALPWDSRRVGNGTQSLLATVTDASGASGSSSRSFNVQNAGGGGTALAASFTSPASGATVRGSVTVGMTQTGATRTPITFTLAVDSTQVFTAVGTATSASFSWNTAGVGNGAHTLRLTARDGAGRTATAIRTVTVSNGTTSAPALGVAVTAPKPDATVRGTVWFTIWVNGSAGGSKSYTLTEGGRTLTSSTTTSAGPVSIPWVTSAPNNGARTVTVTVREGTKSGTGSVRVIVAN